MTAAKFSPAVNIIRPTGGALRVSFTGGGREPAIKIEAFRKAGDSSTRTGKVVISTAMLWPALNAMAEAGVRAIDEAQGVVPTGDGGRVSLDVRAAMARNGGQADG